MTAQPTPSSLPKETSPYIARHALVSGRVQGVGFRMALAEQARNQHVQGWCRNLPDGRVEVWMQGTLANLTPVLDWLHEGPAGARVDQVLIENQAVLEPLLGESIQTFEIRSS